jgi:hypothetical protein
VEESQRANQTGLQAAAVRDGVEEAFLGEKFGALKAGRAHSSSWQAQKEDAQRPVALSSHFTIAFSNSFNSARLPAMNCQ